MSDYIGKIEEINTFTDLRSYISKNRKNESLDIEFKSKESVNSKRLSDKDKKNVGKTLSAFANSYGGILIFGFNDDGKPEPITFEYKGAPDQFRAIIPQKSNWKSKIIRKNKNDPSKGVFEIFAINQSEHKPVRSSYDNVYYHRTNKESQAIEHYILEALFRGGGYPAVVCEPHLEDSGGKLVFALNNEGTTLAELVRVKVDLKRCSTEMDADKYTFPNGALTVLGPKLVNRDFSQVHIYQLDMRQVIYPLDNPEAFCEILCIKTNGKSKIYGKFHLTVRCFAKNMENYMRCMSITISKEGKFIIDD